MQGSSRFEPRALVAYFAAFAVALGGMAGYANAADTLLGHSVSVQKYGGNPTVGKVAKFVIKAAKDGNPASLPLPACPFNGSVVTTRDGGDSTDPLTAGTFTGLGNPPGAKGCKYKNAAAPAGGEVKILLMKEKVIKVVSKGTGTMPAPTGGGADGSTTLVISADADRYCAETHSGASYFKVVAGKLLKDKNAPAPGACSSPSGAFLDQDSYLF